MSPGVCVRTTEPVVSPPVAHILIVDDDPVVSEAISRILSQAGYAVSKVHTAEDGLEAAAQLLPGAIILDMRIPVMGGLAFLRALRQDTEIKTLPVAVLTGNHFLSDEVVRELKSLGASISYKPVRTEDLTALAAAMFADN